MPIYLINPPFFFKDSSIYKIKLLTIYSYNNAYINK